MTHLISIAPMMNCTDRHFRYFLRLIAPKVRLYTEMVVAQALMHRDPARWLLFDEAEHPITLQLGGSDPTILARAAKLGEDYGYDEINLNVGCPSDRVSAGRFGACLMREPKLVADCIAAMAAAVKIPITIKCRIGVDQEDSCESLCHFIEINKLAGCKIFIIHARKAWLSGLNPHENRTIPPLRYEIVRQIKKDFPELTIVINGGFKNIAEIDEQLPFVDGVMIGRAAYSNPYFLREVVEKYFPESLLRSRAEVLADFIPYVAKQLNNTMRLGNITRHIFGLYHGQSGALAWRRYLSEHVHRSGAGIEVLQQVPFIS